MAPRMSGSGELRAVCKAQRADPTLSADIEFPSHLVKETNRSRCVYPNSEEGSRVDTRAQFLPWAPEGKLSAPYNLPFSANGVRTRFIGLLLTVILNMG